MHPTFAGVVRGEWIKLLSLRSTWWALASTAAVITLAALAAAMSLDAMADDPALAPGIQQMHGAEVIAQGFQFGMLTIAVLGVSTASSSCEHATIRSSASSSDADALLNLTVMPLVLNRGAMHGLRLISPP